MNSTEENLDEKIARIRKKNEAIIQRQKLIQEDIKNAEKNNAIVKLKVSAKKDDSDEEFGPTLYSDKLDHETKTIKSFQNDGIWEEKPKPRKNVQYGAKEEAWREERKRIDEERIRRQKANSGSWKREWDANKIALLEEHEGGATSRNTNKFTRNFKNEQPDNRLNHNFNESRRNFDQNDEIENKETGSRWKNDRFNRQVNADRGSSDHRDIRKLNRSDSWRNNGSETDKSNNNTSRLDLKSRISRLGTNQNITVSHPSKNDADLGKDFNVDKPHGPSTQNTKPILSEWRASGDSRPIATKGNKWNHQSDVQIKNRPHPNLESFSTRCDKSEKIRKFERPVNKDEESAFDDSKARVIIPKDLKNIIIHVNRGTKTNERKVEVKNPANVEPEYRDTTEVQNVNCNFGTHDSTPSYGTMTFERSDLKRRETSFYEDLTSPTSIVTQMFSNSRIRDFSPITTNNPQSDKLSQYEDISAVSATNIQQVPNIQSLTIGNSLQQPKVEEIQSTKSHNIKFIRTIKDENMVLPQNPVSTQSNDETKKFVGKSKQNLAETSLEEGEVVDDDEWETDDDGWEDVSGEEDV